MTDKTHQLIGLTIATEAFLVLQPDRPVTWSIAVAALAGSFIGSVAPDIDQPTAKLWDSIPLGGLFGKLTCYALGGHRNLSHSILGTVLFYWLMRWVISFLPPQWGIDHAVLLQSALIGFMAHLLADSVTVMGIPIFWPFGANMGFPPRPFEGIRIITGKWFENLIVFPLVTVLLVAIIGLHLSHFCSILPVCR